MSNLMVAPVTNKGQVTLPKSSGRCLGSSPDPTWSLFASNAMEGGIVPIEIKEKKTSPYNEESGLR